MIEYKTEGEPVPFGGDGVECDANPEELFSKVIWMSWVLPKSSSQDHDFGLASCYKLSVFERVSSELVVGDESKEDAANGQKWSDNIPYI